MPGRPFYVVRRKTWEQESWSANRKWYSGDEKKPDLCIAAPRRPGEPVLFILGMGEIYKEELAEMAERVREEAREREPRKSIVDDVKQAMADRVARHQRNPVTDPAPVYVRG